MTVSDYLAIIMIICYQDSCTRPIYPKLNGDRLSATLGTATSAYSRDGVYSNAAGQLPAAAMTT